MLWAASRKRQNARGGAQKKDSKWRCFSLSVVLSVLTLLWAQNRLLQNTDVLDWQQNAGVPAAPVFSARLEREAAPPRHTLPPNICVFYVVPYNTTSWTPRYLEEFEAFMSKLLLRGWQQQTMLGAVPVLEGAVDAHSVLTPMLRQMGWIPGQSVADHVRQRDQSPGRRCEWVVQTRVDADDYLGLDFVETMVDMLVNEIEYALEGPGFCGEWWKGKPCGTSEPSEALMFSQPRLTRVYLFGHGSSGKRKCLHRRQPYHADGPQPSTGLTLATTRKSYDAHGQPSILKWSHDAFVAYVSSEWKDARHLFFPPDRLMLAPVTSLSGHFPWFFDSDPFEDCSVSNLTHLFGEENSLRLVTMPLPNITILDACLSNQHAQGIMARNIKFKFRTCADLYAHHLELHAARDNGAAVQHYPWPW